jgi:hypothetical protein
MIKLGSKHAPRIITKFLNVFEFTTLEQNPSSSLLELHAYNHTIPFQATQENSEQIEIYTQQPSGTLTHQDGKQKGEKKDRKEKKKSVKFAKFTTLYKASHFFSSFSHPLPHLFVFSIRRKSGERNQLINGSLPLFFNSAERQ